MPGKSSIRLGEADVAKGMMHLNPTLHKVSGGPSLVPSQNHIKANYLPKAVKLQRDAIETKLCLKTPKPETKFCTISKETLRIVRKY